MALLILYTHLAHRQTPTPRSSRQEGSGKFPTYTYCTLICTHTRTHTFSKHNTLDSMPWGSGMNLKWHYDGLPLDGASWLVCFAVALTCSGLSSIKHHCKYMCHTHTQARRHAHTHTHTHTHTNSVYTQLTPPTISFRLSRNTEHNHSSGGLCVLYSFCVCVFVCVCVCTRPCVL